MIGVSDKALLRFMQCSADVDVESLRANLEASLSRAHAAARTVAGCDYLIKADGLIFIVRGDTVTTVTTDKEHPIGRASALEQRRQ